MRYIITSTPEQAATLATLMKEDNANNRTAYINHLIGQEMRRRREPLPIQRVEIASPNGGSGSYKPMSIDI